MKYFYLILILLLSFLSTNAQEEEYPFFNEFAISLNRTNLANENTENRYGFGLGAYYSMQEQKKVNMFFGIEYNQINQFKKVTYEGRYAHATDVGYAIHNLSIPLFVCYGIGNKVKFFIEAGAFIDLIFSSRKKGTMHTFLPDENNNTVHRKFAFSEKADINNLNYGFSGGLGISLPINEKELKIKTDYKYGWNKLSEMPDIYNRYFRLLIGMGI